jgi:superfamily II DNA or RNA helicase/HKD family nuclease
MTRLTKRLAQRLMTKPTTAPRPAPPRSGADPEAARLTRELPSGLYDALVTRGLERLLEGAEGAGLDVVRASLDPDLASEALARHLFVVARALLSSIKGDAAQRLDKQVELTNRLLSELAQRAGAAAHGGDALVDPDDQVTAERLLQVLRRADVRLGAGELPRPSIPLRHSDLLVNGPKDLRVGREIQRELASADRVDVLVSFVKWTGFVELRDALRAFADRHHDRALPTLPLRVLTTTYMGATDLEALEALVELGAEVRVSYDTRHTRLHAKAWLFHRETGFSTGLVGSSNLSHAALRDGCEWNVRLSSVDNGPILRKFEATFEQYWDEGAFEPFERARFLAALEARRDPARDALAAAIRLHPYPHQAAVLDALRAERDAGHLKNLVIAATGTGKTVIAALDYRALCERWGARASASRPSLLFVAHRHEILEKSRATYRAALGDGGFGELCTGADKPLVGRHVFASVQSLHGRALARLAPDAYEVLVVDEFHHAEAETYTRLLEHFAPKVLLGLTATPERADGRSILRWFDHRVAAESRLWDALDQGLLVPFQYFGVSDATDLSQIDFRGGLYSIGALERVYTADEHRAKQVLRALTERVRDPSAMRALGFCVSVAHARFMTAFFMRRGLRAACVTGETPSHERRAALQRLGAGELCCVFTVDVLNEGVDLPSVDTVLFLRPTESATVFLQQLGRGLRLCEGKACLTVLDFIGRAHRKFRFDRRFGALLGGGSRAEVRRAVEEGFPRLPSGCSIALEREAEGAVLDNLRRSLSDWASLGDELAEDWGLEEFLRRAELEPSDLYREGRCFSELRSRRGFVGALADGPLKRSLPRLLHLDDEERLGRWRAWLERGPPPCDPGDPYQRMLFAALGQAQRPLSELPRFFERLFHPHGESERALAGELGQLFALLDGRRRRPTLALPGLPFRTHATYARDEIVAGLGEVRGGKLLRTQAGVLACEARRCDVLFVTLEKDERDFTPTTLYHDYPLSQRRFHWESQSTTRRGSKTGQRYERPPDDWRILLFVRQAKTDARGVTMPYLLLGPVRCQSASGDRPIQIVWELEHTMPAGWFNEVKIAAA